MLDYHGKQIIGILLGIGSYLVIYFLCVTSVYAHDALGIFFGFGLGLILSTIGIIMSGIGIKQANETGGSKAKGVIGLIVSIVGVANCLVVFALLGSVIFLAQQPASAAASNAASIFLNNIL